MSNPTARSLTQQEIDAYNRIDFTDKVIAAVRGTATHGGIEVRFLAIKNHHNLVCIKQIHVGEFEFSAGDNHFYSYRLSDLVAFLEKIYDDSKVVALHGEFEIEATHQTANADAEEA